MNKGRLAHHVLTLGILCPLLCSRGAASPEPPASLSSEVQEHAFHSASLNRDMRYRILLPPGYEGEEQRRFPVLYLLHGLGDDERSWTTNTAIALYAGRFSLIVVMPAAETSWYVDSAAETGLHFERYIVEDLRAEVEGHFRADPRRVARAIAGQSMGGYGAIKIALRHPGVFAVAGSLSGALDAAADPGYFDKFGPGAGSQAKALLDILGAAGSAHRRANDPFLLVRSATAEHAPYLYLNCGSRDMQLPANRRFVAELESHQAAFEFHEYPGDHNWKYWNQQLPGFLAMIAERLQGAK